MSTSLSVKQIVARVRRHHRITRPGVYQHLRVLNIKPFGVAVPRRYPIDAADKILVRLGFKQPKSNGNDHSNRRRKNGKAR